jgi:hypothetical protein
LVEPGDLEQPDDADKTVEDDGATAISDEGESEQSNEEGGTDVEVLGPSRPSWRVSLEADRQ